MPSILKTISNFLVAALSVFAISYSVTTQAKSAEVCKPIEGETEIVVENNLASSSLCVADHLYTLTFNLTTNKLQISTPKGRFLLSKIPKNYSPTLVGAEDKIRILPRELQPYLSQNILLFTSALRTRGNDGAGQCGAGEEVFLNTLNISKKNPKIISKLLISSCAKSIDLAGSDELNASFISAFSVINNRLEINFINYSTKENLTALISSNYKELEFMK
jgi:hypothetical protein